MMLHWSPTHLKYWRLGSVVLHLQQCCHDTALAGHRLQLPYNALKAICYGRHAVIAGLHLLCSPDLS